MCFIFMFCKAVLDGGDDAMFYVLNLFCFFNMMYIDIFDSNKKRTVWPLAVPYRRRAVASPLVFHLAFFYITCK